MRLRNINTKHLYANGKRFKNAIKVFAGLSLVLSTQVYSSSTALNNAEETDVDINVVNGTVTPIGSRTYQVAIERNGQQGCGGTLVAPQWVLTAGHCTAGLSTSNTQVRAGSHYRNSGGNLHGVDQIINHPSWSGSVQYGNDLALIHLTSPVASNLEIASLPTTAIENAIAGVGANVVVSGWGTTYFQGQPSSVLREAALPVMSTAACQQELGGTIDGKVVCGAGPAGKSACNGDSGGPYVAYQNGQAYSIGTVSWGRNCSGASVFTRTTSFKSWIESYIGGGGGGGGSVTELTNGVAVSASGASQSETFYTLEVPAGATNLSFVISGGTGDADLYVKAGSQPTTASYDCRPYLNGNNETCNINNIQPGTYHVMLRGYTQYAGATLTGSYSDGGGGGNQAPNANFTYSVSSLVVSFTDTSTDDGGIVSRTWNFGDGSVSSSVNPTHSYSAAGSYSVSLTVTDAEGLSSVHSQTVSVSNGGGGSGCAGLSEWHITTSYVPGDEVSYNGVKYASTWYSTGAQPDVFTQVWDNLGPCQ